MADKPFKFLKIKGGTDKYHPVDETARNSIGDLSQLETVNKSNLVAAINEAAKSGGSDSLFECTYGVTTFSEVSNAVAAGKICYLYKTASANVKYLYILEYIYPVTIGYQARFYRVLDNWQNRYAIYLSSNTGAWSTDSQPLSVWYGDQVRGKPTIGGVEVSGNKTLAQYGIASATEIGDLEELDTTDKSDLVSAINEVVAGGAVSPEDIQDAVDEYLETHPTVTGTFTNAAKNALIALLRKVAYIDGNGETYLNALINELFAVSVESITAVFTQGANVVYTNDNLDSLKQYLVVTANYTGGTSEVLDSSAYSLTGVLSEGTSTITVTYSNQTDTFTVVCTVNGWLYHFEQTLASSGANDFGFNGSVTYDTGHDGVGYCIYNNPECISASGFTAPNLSGDFTISFWAKTLVANNGQGFSPYAKRNTSTTLADLGTASNIKSGWSVDSPGVTNAYSACRLGSWQSYNNATAISTRLYNAALSKGTNFVSTPPSGFDSTAWHHYAWTRKSGTFRFFVDGEVIFTSSISDALGFATQCAFGGWYDSSTPSTPSANKSWYDDLFVAEYCNWDSDFNPNTITY